MKYQNLNLEQKLIKIRKKVPVLIKQFHSDEVGYDFSKLDDIYQLMTPALNKYGVNFDIIGEKPTMFDEAGHPVYLTLDKDGYWRYEADLELCWKNACLPEQISTVTIHAVGTHEVPDKAKGAAWTYALKYYLRNKFCVPQGSGTEDPDMRGTDTPEEEQGQTGKTNSSKQRQSTQDCAKQEPVKQEQKTGKVKELPVKAKSEKRPFDEAAVKDILSSSEEKKESQVKKEIENGAEVAIKEAKSEKTTEGQTKKQEDTKEKLQKEHDFTPVSEEDEIPFDDFDDDCGFMDDLNEEIGMKELEDTEDTSAYESARNYKCTFGIFKDKTLGEMLDSGKKGRDGLRWLSTSYKGSDTEMVKAAKMLLEKDENNAEAMAA